jgi:uncharacterized protein (DUF934 family)
MRLVRNGEIAEDPYLRPPDDDPLPDEGAVLVSADRLLADADAITKHKGAAGVLWPNDRAVPELAPHLDRLALIALSFPSFRDGRAYSQARILRERYGFRGELRATGQILRDQFLFLLRSGFDAFEVTKDTDVAAFADSVRRYSVFYQPGADGSPPAFRRRLAPPDVPCATTCDWERSVKAKF